MKSQVLNYYKVSDVVKFLKENGVDNADLFTAYIQAEAAEYDGGEFVTIRKNEMAHCDSCYFGKLDLMLSYKMLDAYFTNGEMVVKL